jgi:hypothetical protein
MKTAKAVLLGKLKPQGVWPLANYDPFALKAKRTKR